MNFEDKVSITSYIKHRTSYLTTKIVITSCFIFVLSYITNAQWYDPEKVDHNANTIYSLALNKAQSEDYITSIKMINEALKIEPKFVDAYLSLAGINANMKNYKESVNQFEKAFALDSVYTYNYLLPYSISLAGTGRFNDALNAVNKFLLDTTINARSRKAGE